MTQNQQKLFEEPAPWDLDDEERLVGTVVFAEGPPRAYSYLIPEGLVEQLSVGQRVRAPLGKSNRPLTGYLVALETLRVSKPLKELAGIVDARSLLSPGMLRLTRWMADYYLCPWGQALEAVVPAGVRTRAGTRMTTLLTAAEDAAAKLPELKLPKKQLLALKWLIASSDPLTPEQLGQAVRCTQAPITALRRKGLIRAQSQRVQWHEPEVVAVAPEPPHELNAEQQLALDAILTALRDREHSTLLLHGITGSGKTEVYIRAIDEVVSYGRQAIVLVPEISLTPQTEQRFKARFGRVAVLHSHLTDSERHWHWERIARGDVNVVVGARSAVFAPTPNLGLIVLDEEHEASFKQETAPRYHARHVARQRAILEKIPLVLGSATPALETWHHARAGEYQLLELPKRVLDRPMPDVVIVDLRMEAVEHRGHRSGAISRQLRLAMSEALADGGQVILLLNRRGFSTQIQCASCGFVVRCPNCDLALTHHRQQHIALCHYCDFELPAPAKCPECQSPVMDYYGMGTQKLEAEVRSRFPEYPCLRMDTDTMQAPGSHEKALAAFRGGDVRILLGTQMIAKGLDFPNVTVVGVINADTALHFPDFRAAERTFQLLVQVAGRTGRGSRGGRVLVQTLNPDHPAIRAAARHDYHTFATLELEHRRALVYPPFGHMARLVVRGPQEQVASQFAEHLGEVLRSAVARQDAAREQTGGRVLGPAAAPMAKLRGNYRFHIQAQSPDDVALRAAVLEATESVKPPDNVQWIVDIDPLDML